MADEWEDISNLDYYDDIRKRIPGVQVTSGFRTKEYQQDMRRRGYKPAENSEHLLGEKLDFTHPKGNKWLQSEIARHYPEAQFLNEGDHLDVRFPGYRGAPALGGAAKAGLKNPNRQEESEWEDITEVAPPSVEGNWSATPEVDPLAGAAAFGADMSDPVTAALMNKNQSALSDQVAGSALPPSAVEGDWGERVLHALTTGILPEEVRYLPIAGQIDALLRVMEAQTEAIRGTPLEGAALAFPMGGMELGFGTTPKSGVRTVDRNKDGIISGSDLLDDLPEEGLTGIVTDEAQTPLSQQFKDKGMAGVEVERSDGVFSKANTFSEGEVADMLGARLKRAEPEAAAPKRPPVSRNDALSERVTNITKDWKNAPTFRIADEIPDDVPADSMGMVSPDGKITVFSKNTTPEDVSAVVFHEALGHVGLKNLFREKLDEELVRLWKGNQSLRDDVNKYNQKNSTIYEEDKNPLARAIEEVFAERSQNGQLTAGMLDKVKQTVKTFARKAGLKMEITDSEVQRILSMAHDTVTKGENVAPDGTRFMVKPPKITPSEASSNPDKYKLNWENLVTSRKEAAGTFLNELGVHNGGELMRMSAEEVIAKAERLGIDQEWVDYFNDRRLGIKTPQPDMNKYLPDVKFMRLTQKGTVNAQDVKTTQQRAQKNQQRTGKAGSINLDRLTSTKDIKPMIAEMAKQVKAKPQTHEETLMKAQEMTPQEVTRLLDKEGWTPEEVTALDQTMVSAHNRVANLSKQIAEGDNSDAVKQQFLDAVTKSWALTSKASETHASLGRALNALTILKRSQSKASANFRFMLEQLDMNNLKTPEDVEAFARTLYENKDNYRLVRTMVKKALDPKLEDKIRAWRMASLFSGPRTQVTNFIGTGANVLHDLVTSSVTPRGWKEFFPRLHGMKEGIADAFRPVDLGDGKMEAPIVTAWKTGTSDGSGSSKIEHSNLAFKGTASNLIEWPQKMMASSDQFWSNVVRASELRGTAVQTAYKEGLRGEAMERRVKELLDDPTEQMLDSARDKSENLRFVDQASWLTRNFERLTRRNNADDGAARAYKFGLRMVLPIVHTPDRMLAWAVRNSPAGVISPRNIRDFKAGGVRRQQAVARWAIGSAVYGWLASKYANGELTGNTLPNSYQDSLDQQALEGKRRNSIKLGDTWYSYEGLEPFTLPAALIANIGDGVNKKGGDDWMDNAIAAISSTASAAVSATYAEDLHNLFKNLDPKSADSAFGTFLGGMVASMIPDSALLRTVGDFFDDTVYDRKGDGTVSDIAANQIKNVVPGMRQEMPAQRDVLGEVIRKDPAVPSSLVSRTTVNTPKSDPLSKELARLSRLSPSPLIGTVRREKGVSSEDYQHHQELAGKATKEAVEEFINSDEYKTMNDQERLIEIKSIRTKVRKQVKESLEWETIE